MAAVGLSAEAADARLKKEGLQGIVVGCDNSPSNVTLAGKLHHGSPSPVSLRPAWTLSVCQLMLMMRGYGKPAQALSSLMCENYLSHMVGTVSGCLSGTQTSCDASASSAGPQEELSPLCAKLKDEGVFVRELDTLGIAYHSPALNPFCDKLRRALSAVVPNPKERSKRWLSTCFPLDSDEAGARTCGPDYHVRPLPCFACWPVASHAQLYSCCLCSLKAAGTALARSLLACMLSIGTKSACCGAASRSAASWDWHMPHEIGRLCLTGKGSW